MTILLFYLTNMLERHFRFKAIVTFLGVLICFPVSHTIYNTQMTERSLDHTGLLENNASAGFYFLDQLPLLDYTTLIDLKNFKFVFNNIVCNETSPLLLTLVHSAPTNTAKRKTIRETWGQTRPSLKVLFLVGTVGNAELQAQLEHENSIYKDMVQGNFVDAYRNLTYKHVMALKYATYHCPQAKYILKSDDDVFVNMPTLMDYLSYDISPVRSRQLLMCIPAYNEPIKRNQSKWTVTYKEFKGKFFPTFCQGGLPIIYSPDVVFTLYQDAQRTALFWIDDVHITGTLAKRRNITITTVTDDLRLNDKQVKDVVERGKNDTLPPVFLYGTPWISERDIRGLWEYVKYKTSNHQTL